MTGSAPDSPSGDYSYDLAHDEVPASGAAQPGRPPGPAGTPEHGEDTGGDYSYDLAHEVPPAER